jgi:hypothetical protein
LIAALGAAAPAPAAAPAAGAAPAARVVLLRAPADDALTRQATTLLIAELNAAGFDVVQAERSASSDLRAEIEATSARLQPVATVAIRALPGAEAQAPAMELWLEDRLTGKLVIRRIDVASGPEGAAAADLALKAVELLHGSLLEVTVQPPAERPPTPPAVTRWLKESAPDRPSYFARGLGLAAGAAALVAGGGVGATYAPAVRLGWGGASGFVGRVTALGLGSTSDLTTDEGSARVHQTLVLVEGLRVFRRRARWQPLAGAGVGAYHVRSEGTGASSLFPAGAGSATAVAIAGQAGIALRVTGRVALTADASLLWLTPATHIVIGTREAARAGGLSLLGALSVCSVF